MIETGSIAINNRSGIAESSLVRISDIRHHLFLIPIFPARIIEANHE